MTEQLNSMDTHSSKDDNVLSADTSLDQTETFICGEGKAVGVAEAALQDGERESKTNKFFCPRSQSESFYIEYLLIPSLDPILT